MTTPRKIRWKPRPSGDEWECVVNGHVAVVFHGPAEGGTRRWYSALDGRVFARDGVRVEWSRREHAEQYALEQAGESITPAVA